MYDDVLLAVDGSEGSEGAIERAIDVARQTGARLHVVSVVDTTSIVTAASADSGKILDALEAETQRAVDETIERAETAGVGTIEASVLAGTPHRSILDYAEERDVDVVVVGTHGRTGLEHAVLGSVAERVVRRADAPVLVVPSG